MKINSRTKDLLLNYLISVVLVILVGSILIGLQGSNSFEAYFWIIKGALGSKSAVASSIRWMMPVMFASLAAVVAQKSGIVNLGIEGQLYFGALVTALVGAFIDGPKIVMLPFVIITGGCAGLLYALLPALLKIYYKVDEMITTLMLNYVAIQTTEFITLRVMNLTANVNPDFIATPEISQNIALTRFLKPYQATSGIFFVIILGIAIHFFYMKTYRGFEWKMLGMNSTFAKYGGVNEKKNCLQVFLLSGFIAGMCGAFEILGPHLRFRTNFSSNIGWDGIMVSLIANNNPLGVLFTSAVWGCIKAGSLMMERMTDVNRVIVTLVQAIFVLFITVNLLKVFREFRSNTLDRKQKNEENK